MVRASMRHMIITLLREVTLLIAGLTILNFLIEKGSVVGYLLRECKCPEFRTTRE